MVFSIFVPNIAVRPAHPTLLSFKKKVVLFVNEKYYVTFLQIAEMDYGLLGCAEIW